MKNRKIYCLIIFIIPLLFLTSIIHASKKKVTTTPPADFLVQPILTKDNIGGKNIGYFNLKKSSKKRIIEFRIFNMTKYPLKINTKLSNASTLDNGVIDYTGVKKNNKIIKKPGTQYLYTFRNYTIPAKQDIVIPVNIKKTTDFKGIKASAINIIGKPEQQKGSIDNKYIYSIAILLNGKNLKNSELNKLRIDDIFIKNKIKLSLDNPDAELLLKERIKVTIQSAKWLTFNYQKTRSNMKIAPNSKFNFDIPLEGKKKVSGVYKLIFEGRNNKYKQKIVKYIKISNGKIYFISKEAYNTELIKNIVMYTIIFSSIIAIGIIIRKKYF